MVEISLKVIKAHTLENSIKHNGEANKDAILSGLFAEGLEKKDVKEFIPKIKEVIKEVSSLSLKEKKYRDYGEIDGGIYLIKRNVFASFENNNRFSFNDFIMNNLKNLKVGSLLCDELFIDIGTPEDLSKAQRILKNYL